MALPAFCYWDFLEAIETVQMHDAFKTYCALGGRRTISKVAELHQMPYGSVWKWSQAAVWKERCEEYDKALLAERTALLAAAQGASQTAWADRRAALMNELEQIAFSGAAQLLHEMRTHRRTLRPNELRLIVETLTKWQNLANGDATDHVDFRVNLSKLSDAELAAYEELLNKASEDDSQTPAAPGELH